MVISRMDAGWTTAPSSQFNQDRLEAVLRRLAVPAEELRGREFRDPAFIGRNIPGGIHNKGLELSCIIDRGVPVALPAELAGPRSVLIDPADKALKFSDCGALGSVNPYQACIARRLTHTGSGEE